MTLFDSERDYRQIIRDAYQERLNEDSSYTWRQFSRLVNISPSRMSEVMSGKGNLTTRSARLIAEGLGFTPMEADYFRLLIQSEAAQYKEERARSLRQARVLRCRHHLSRLGTDIEGQPGAIDLALHDIHAKAAGVPKGSGEPNRDKVAKISRAQSSTNSSSSMPRYPGMFLASMPGKISVSRRLW